ncbi:MAG: hypothetical protein COB01_05790 [Lutibacter sp.]|nr:MAG: hypothetical protein COB01_05790 [Lutibacter sp.]
MKKNIFIISIFSILFSGCDKLDELLKDDERTVGYNVIFKETAQNFEYLTTITFTGEDGYNQFDEHQSAFSRWSEGGDFSKGERVSLAISTSLDRGTITLTIICKDCKNEDLIDGKIIKTIDLTRIKVGELSLNLE